MIVDIVTEPFDLLGDHECVNWLMPASLDFDSSRSPVAGKRAETIKSRSL